MQPTYPHWHVFTSRSDGIDKCVVCDRPRVSVNITTRPNTREDA